MFIIIGLGVLSFAGICYLALSRKSSFKLRIAALGALALMVVSVIIGIWIVFANAAAPDKIPVLPDAPVPADTPAENSSAVLVFFIVFLVALFLVIMLLSLREQRKSAEQKAKGKAV